MTPIVRVRYERASVIVCGCLLTACMYIKGVNAEGRQAVALHEELFGRLHTALEAKDMLQGIAFKVRSLLFRLHALEEVFDLLRRGGRCEGFPPDDGQQLG